MKLYDTIAAVSTPRGKGGIAIIRISGDDALKIADRIFAPLSKVLPSAAEHSKALYGRIYADEKRDIPIDDGIVTVFRAPRSFTGEDTVEISCHGGLLVTEAVLTAVLSSGARHAEAGEFSRRAFVNGKMALSEAEALSNLLEAKNYSQLRLARSGLEGKLKERCDEIYNSIKRVLASLYAKIDYPDEELADLSYEDMSSLLKKELSNVEALLSTYKSGHAVAEGIKTVICGRPNVGKSSLYNKILGKDAAIVTDLAGTTRDILDETATLGRVTVRLFDTAGLHEATDKVEEIGIKRAYGCIEDAELILAVFDASSPLTHEDEEMILRLSDKREHTVALLNKSELDAQIDKKRIASIFDEVIEISAKSEDGIAPLIKFAEERFLDKALDIDRDAIVFGARQQASLIRAAEYLKSAVEIVEYGISADAAAVQAECAMSALLELDGRATSEDIIAEIFASFCVGK